MTSSHQSYTILPLLFLLIANIFCLPRLNAQQIEGNVHYPTDYFDSPLHIPVTLSATFAEIRPNHFHSGLDLRIGGKIGEPIYAPADGYVSRINISAWGGGKVLYISHPNGFTTVYMHCNDFVGEIASYTNNYQYAHHTFIMDVKLPVDSIKVQRGQLIAHAGNTGGSGGPHLHYEIRYTENDQPINPLYFGLKYTDHIKPTIRNIKVYPINASSRINGGTLPIKLKKSTSKGDRWIDTITVQGIFYVGIYATDKAEGSTSKNGVERIELFVDGEPFYRYYNPTFLFEETRSLHAIIDYDEFRSNGDAYILTRCLRGNHNVFSSATNANGYLRFNDGLTHKLQYVVSDLKGNKTAQTFYVRDIMNNNNTPYTSIAYIDRPGEPVTYYKQKRLEKNDFIAIIPVGTIYENDFLAYNELPANLLAPIHSLDLTLYPIPPHHAFTVRLRYSREKAESYHIDPSKLVIVCTHANVRTALSTYCEGEWLVGQTRYFGTFSIEADTVAPLVTPMNFSPAKPITNNLIKIKMSDNLSGISSYNCYINGHWVLAEHDGKTASLTINGSKHLHKGTNLLRAVVVDVVGNETDLQWNIIKT